MISLDGNIETNLNVTLICYFSQILIILECMSVLVYKLVGR